MVAKTELHTETHPNWYHEIPVMRTLILGSFPPHESKRDYRFFYPNKQNNFWKILAAVNKTELRYFEGEKAVQERKRLMETLAVGVENMGQVIERKGLSARDTDIRIKTLKDITRIFNRHPELERVLLAGFSAPSSTYNTFLRFLSERKIPFTAPAQIKPGSSFTIKFNGRSIRCIILNSTSTAARIKLSTLVEQFEKFILA